MGHHSASDHFIGNERAHLIVFHGNFFCPGQHFQDLFQGFIGELTLFLQTLDALLLNVTNAVLQSLDQTIEGDFRRIGNK